MEDDDQFYQKTTEITRDARSPRQNAPWKLGITTPQGHGNSSTSVEYLTQGELLTLWQQIGVLFDLEGMRSGLTDADLEKMGVYRK